MEVFNSEIVKNTLSDTWRGYQALVSMPVVFTALNTFCVIIFLAICTSWVAPYDPYNAASLSLMDAFIPPVWEENGDGRFFLGTDGQGRDLWSAILYGSRISLFVGVSAVFLALVLGVCLGITAGYFGGHYETFVMRIADAQLSIPGILMALLVDGVARGILQASFTEQTAIYMLIAAIGFSEWPQFARVVRAQTLVEMQKDYISASKIMGVSNVRIMRQHILPNIFGPVMVIGAVSLALAILAEATLSFLGIGVSPTTPSLGTLIRLGNDFLFSGEWWIVFFPSFYLIVISFSINLLGDWLRDEMDPKSERWN